MVSRIGVGLLLAGVAGMAMAEDAPEVIQAKAEGEAPIGVLLAVGDIARCGTSQERRQDEAVAATAGREIARAEASDLPVRLVLLGDLAYPAGTAEQYAKCFDPAWGRFKDAMLPVPGNHEYKGGEDADAFFSYFSAAPVALDGAPLVTSEGDGLRGDYDLRFPNIQPGPWLLIGLDTGRDREPEDLDWLRGVLERNRGMGALGARCVLAFAHHFRFSSGLHGHGGDEEDPDASLVAEPRMAETFDLLDRFGASVLLSGHDHHFEQFAPQDSEGHADPEGLRSFIVGTGGGDPYLKEMPFRYQHQAANQEYLDGGHYGLLRIVLYADRYEWSFVRTDGTEVAPEPHEAECQRP